MSMPKPFVFQPGTNANLDDYQTRIETVEHNKKSAAKQIRKNSVVMADRARRLYAENKRSILLVLQGMDSAGKDGTIRSVMRGMNPRSCQVVSFKKPSEEEIDHDFLWRIHKHTPRRGHIGIFNRSHYEDVLVVRVHSLVPEEDWKKRYQMINEFEQRLTDCGTTIVKCFLHISNEEQRERLQARIDEPESNWKYNPRDLAERKLWGEYQTAYQDAINQCNTSAAPWHIVPSDRKWYRNLIVSNLMRHVLEELDPQYPTIEEDIRHIRVE